MISEKLLRKGPNFLAEVRIQRQNLDVQLGTQHNNGNPITNREITERYDTNGGSKLYPITVDTETGRVSSPTATGVELAQIQGYANHYEWGRPISPQDVHESCFSDEARARHAEEFPHLTPTEIAQTLAGIQGMVDISTVFTYFPIITERTLKDLEGEKERNNGNGH